MITDGGSVSGKLQTTPTDTISHPVNLSRSEYYLIQRLRQLAQCGNFGVWIEFDGRLRWRVAGKIEG